MSLNVHTSVYGTFYPRRQSECITRTCSFITNSLSSKLSSNYSSCTTRVTGVWEAIVIILNRELDCL